MDQIRNQVTFIQEITSVGEDVEKREPLFTVGGNVHISTTIIENRTGVSQEIKNRTTI